MACRAFADLLSLMVMDTKHGPLDTHTKRLVLFVICVFIFFFTIIANTTNIGILKNKTWSYIHLIEILGFFVQRGTHQDHWTKKPSIEKMSQSGWTVAKSVGNSMTNN